MDEANNEITGIHQAAAKRMADIHDDMAKELLSRNGFDVTQSPEEILKTLDAGGWKLVEESSGSVVEGTITKKLILYKVHDVQRYNIKMSIDMGGVQE